MIAKSEKWRYDGKCGCSVYEACPRCIGIYEQGKKDAPKKELTGEQWKSLIKGVGKITTLYCDEKARADERKQTLTEVLKSYIAKIGNRFDYQQDNKFKEQLEQKIKELKEASK